MIAAMVLGAPLLSGDGKALAAVYGPDVDLERHEGYLNALFGGGRVLVVSQWGQAALMLARLFGGLGAAGLRTATTKVGAGPLLLAVTATLLWGLSSDRTRAWLLRMKDPFGAFGQALLDVYEFYLDAERAYGRLESPDIPDLSALPAHVAAARETACLAAFELRPGLNWEDRIEVNPIPE